MPQDIACRLGAYALCLGVFAAAVLFCPSSAAAVDKVDATALKIIKRSEFLGKLREPAAIYFDETKQRLYVADSGNKRLVSFDDDFEYLSELGDERFGSPATVVKSASGDFYILDTAASAVKLINLQEKSVVEVKFSGVPGAREPFVPGRFALDSSGMLYVADRLNGRILVFEPTGKFVREITVRGDRAFRGINYVHVGADGSVYAVDSVGQRVYVFDSKGKAKFVIVSGKGADDSLLFPSAVVTDKGGLIYVADKHAGRILVYANTGGKPRYAVGVRGVNDSQIYSPTDIFVDSKQRIFVLDGSRITVFKFDVNYLRPGR